MEFTVLTIFPEMFPPFWENGIIRRAIEQGIISASAINIRDFTTDRHRTTDDRPYGGGCGMVMKPEPLADAIRTARANAPSSKTVLMTPQGRPFNQRVAEELSLVEGLIFVCGRYEGVDERICRHFIDDEISIGDYVLTGGELASMIIMDAVTRLRPGALGGEESAARDSFSENVLEHAHYTRPRNFEGDEVPDVLLSGNHREIEKWRLETSLIRTFLKRPDLLRERPLSPHEINILKNWCSDIETIIQTRSLPDADPPSGGQ
ncbi:tRNA (guanosine(37)-N1)-methyltransferase TrmD [Desulfonema ishimotonii]|uniref:tRNA (guanine-N(1)-)-methyltransferase n=1 Tax=Desulfonema ishimotonii TaxID=45657 RepID=A0A401FR68_9BACT|nr:tRNA (guanosine(37)-N1)-methyltransferase TrmD [Desulfonema ishimotonii]GBC59455.1 tRNA (guanosine(37)-N1)-methyltransferase TrmD [Desulfonema ishimotonii]